MKAHSGKRRARIGLISLGCAKNLVDAEIMLGALLKDGMEITNDAAQADVVIVNTCSFIDSAQEESVDAILESDALREAKNRGQALIVSGCLPQRFRDQLPKLLPEVDAFMGIDQVANASDIIGRAMARRAERLQENQRPEVSGQRSAFKGRKSKVDGQKSKAGGRNASISRQLGDAAKTAHRSPRHEPRSIPRPRKSGIRPSESPFADPAANVRSPSSIVHPPSPTFASAPLVDVALRPAYIPDYATPRFRLTPRHFAYVKIAEGCNHPCSFCIIPRMRGSHRSRPQADIVAEARALIAEGVKELNLISQDSTYYGLDLRPNHSRAISSPDRFQSAVSELPGEAATICSLLRELNSLPGDFWIRLLYTHPAHWTDELIRTLAECPKVARYVDIPLQHIHENMLERMRRETSRQYIVDLLRKIRAGIPGIALRTTFIVGFPGERDEYFEALLEFIRETKFERLGVFAYSQEEATRAGAMAGQISDQVKRQRRDLAMAVQQKVAREVSRSFVGRTLKVLVDGSADKPQAPDGGIRSWEHGLMRGPKSTIKNRKSRIHCLARGEADAPDIDGRVYVRGRLPLGEFARVRIVGCTDYDLLAEPE